MNTSNELEILRPEKVVRIMGTSVTVREMPWRDALPFVQHLAATLGRYADAAGQVVLTQDTLAQIVAESGDLVEELVTKSTGLTPKQIGDLRPGEVLDLVAAAVELNLHADLLGKAHQVGRAIAHAIPNNGTAGPASST